MNEHSVQEHDNYDISFYDVLEMSNEKTILQKSLEHLAKVIYEFDTGRPSNNEGFFLVKRNPLQSQKFSENRN